MAVLYDDSMAYLMHQHVSNLQFNHDSHHGCVILTDSHNFVTYNSNTYSSWQQRTDYHYSSKSRKYQCKISWIIYGIKVRSWSNMHIRNNERYDGSDEYWLYQNEQCMYGEWGGFDIVWHESFEIDMIRHWIVELNIEKDTYHNVAVNIWMWK